MDNSRERALNKIQMLRKKIVNMVDASEQADAEKLLSDLLAAQACADIEDVEIIVPSRTIEKKVDLGPISIMKLNNGILFVVKGGLTTFIDMRMRGLYNTFCEIIDNHIHNFTNIEDKSERDLHEAYALAWAQVMQAPIVCGLDPAIVCDTALMLAQKANEKYKEYEDALKQELDLVKPETSEDAQKNIDFGNQLSLLGQMDDNGGF